MIGFALISAMAGAVPDDNPMRDFATIGLWEVFQAQPLGECVAIETLPDDRMFSVHYWPRDGRAAVSYIDPKLGTVEKFQSYTMHVVFAGKGGEYGDARDVSVRGYRSLKGVPGFSWDVKAEDFLDRMKAAGAIVFMRTETGFSGGAPLDDGGAVAAALRRCGAELPRGSNTTS